MKTEMDICVSNTFSTKKEIKPYLTLARVNGYDVKVIHMTHQYANIHKVPLGIIKKMEKRFEPIDREQKI